MTVHPQYFVWTSKQQFHFIIYLTDKSKQKTSESLWYFGLVMIHLLHCILCSTCITIGPGQRWAENQTGEKKRIYNSRNYGGCQMLRILFIFLFVVLLSRFFNASGHYDALKHNMQLSQIFWSYSSPIQVWDRSLLLSGTFGENPPKQAKLWLNSWFLPMY